MKKVKSVLAEYRKITQEMNGWNASRKEKIQHSLCVHMLRKKAGGTEKIRRNIFRIDLCDWHYFDTQIRIF
jgi:hypothetical protein